MRKPALTADALSKTYATDVGIVEALRPTTFGVGRASIVVVSGVSGSGKSTLLRLLAGLERPTHGRLMVDGVDVTSMNGRGLRRYRREHVTVVTQHPAANLLPHLPLRKQVPGDESGLFARLGLEHRADARPAQLSGGELARAAFAVALARGAPLVLCDEPTAELDDETAALVTEAIKLQREAGTTMLIATHDERVVSLADDVIELGETDPAPALPARPARPAAGSGVVVRASGLTKSYGSVHAVEDVGLELHAGELALAVGRSGSGKSTLLMLLGAWERPDAGKIESELTRSWHDIAYVPQRFGLAPELTVRENIEIPLRLAADPRGAEAVPSLLEALELEALADRYPYQTSIGQQQRAALARGLVLRPRLLLVDEPTSHQDERSRQNVWSVLRRAADFGTSCFVATHESAAEYADAVWTMRDGRIAAAPR